MESSADDLARLERRQEKEQRSQRMTAMARALMPLATKLANRDQHIDTLNQRSDALTKRLEALERGEKIEPGAQPGAPPAPKPFAFQSWDEHQAEHPDATYEDYTDARQDARWAHKQDAESATATHNAQQTQAKAAQTAENTLIAENKTRVDQFVKHHPDFMADVEASEAPLTVTMNVAMMKSPIGPAVAQYIIGHPAASAWTWPGRVSRGRFRGRARPRSHAELLPRRRRVGRPHARLGRVPRRAIPHQHITELGRQDGRPCGVPVPPAGVATFAHARAHAWAVTIPRPRPAWTPAPRRSRGAATTTTRARASRPTGIVASSTHDHDASTVPATVESRGGCESVWPPAAYVRRGVAGAGVSAAGGSPILFLRNIKDVMLLFSG